MAYGTHYLSESDLRSFFFGGEAFGANTITEDEADALSSNFDNLINSVLDLTAMIDDTYGSLSNLEASCWDMHLSGKGFNDILRFVKKERTRIIVQLSPTRVWDSGGMR